MLRGNMNSGSRGRSASNVFLPVSFSGAYSTVTFFLLLIALAGKWAMLFPTAMDCGSLYLPSIPIVEMPKIIASREIKNPCGAWERPVPIISIDKHGRIFIGRKLIAADRFKDELAEAQNEKATPNSGKPLVMLLNADSQIPYEKVISILKVSRSLGIERAGLIVTY
jgi:biopolymer transport protein ExbD